MVRGIFKLIDKYYRWKIKRQLKNVNFALAAMSLIQYFNENEVLIPKQLAALAKEFINNPSLESAMKLVDYDPKLAGFFGAFL